MALETLKDVKEIDGFNVLNIDQLAKENPEQWDAENRRFDWDWFKANVYPKSNYIVVDDAKNTITFKIQNGPIKENGVNGCQVDTMIHTPLRMIEELDKMYPCKENSSCLYHLSAALRALADRKKDREKRGVEGLNKE